MVISFYGLSTKIDGWLNVPKKHEQLDVAGIGESLAENPAVQKLIDKVIDRSLFRKSFLVFSLVNACLIAGVFYIVNSLVSMFKLGDEGGLFFGIILCSIGTIYTVRRLIQNERRESEKAG